MKTMTATGHLQLTLYVATVYVMILLKEIQSNQGKRKNLRDIITKSLIFELTTEHRFEYRTAMLRPIIDESLVPFYRIAAIKEFLKICSSRECYINRRLTPVGSRGPARSTYVPILRL